jgi:abhydrolase domain-containing protein 17
MSIDRLLFLPQPASYRDDETILKVPTAGGHVISALYLPNPAAVHTILYSHGNAEDIGHLRPMLESIRRTGFSVFAYDYPGYGTSTGRPTTRNAYDAVDAAYAYLTNELGVPPSAVIAHGRSLGGGPSAALAAREPIAGLILESTFRSVILVVLPFSIPLVDRFPVERYVRRTQAPILVIHGERDEVISVDHGRRLYEAAPGKKQALWVDRAGHNDLFLVAGARYSEALRAFSSLAADAAPAP